jgi:hypothetical protein
MSKPSRAARIAAEGMPASASLPTTSQWLTALIDAPRTTAATKAAPGSAFSSASTADASSTASATAGLVTTFGDQLLGEPPLGRDVPAYERLRSFYGIT